MFEHKRLPCLPGRLEKSSHKAAVFAQAITMGLFYQPCHYYKSSLALFSPGFVCWWSGDKLPCLQALHRTVRILMVLAFTQTTASRSDTVSGILQKYLTQTLLLITCLLHTADYSITAAHYNTESTRQAEIPFRLFFSFSTL